jgi:hypothetical protein
VASTNEALLLAQVNFLLYSPVCVIHQATLQTVTTNIITAITMDGSDFDPFGMHSTSVNNSRITPTIPGRYLVAGVANWAVSTAGARNSIVRLNGSATVSGSSVTVPAAGSAFATGVPTGTVTVFLNGSTDYVELVVDQNSGGNLNTIAGNSGLMVQWVRAL